MAALTVEQCWDLADGDTWRYLDLLWRNGHTSWYGPSRYPESIDWPPIESARSPAVV